MSIRQITPGSAGALDLVKMDDGKISDDTEVAVLALGCQQTLNQIAGKEVPFFYDGKRKELLGIPMESETGKAEASSLVAALDSKTLGRVYTWATTTNKSVRELPENKQAHPETLRVRLKLLLDGSREEIINRALTARAKSDASFHNLFAALHLEQTLARGLLSEIDKRRLPGQLEAFLDQPTTALLPGSDPTSRNLAARGGTQSTPAHPAGIHPKK